MNGLLPLTFPNSRFGVQVFTESGTFIMPPNIPKVTVSGFIIGGGGGGQSGRGNNGDTTTNNGTAGTASSFDAVTAAGGSGGGSGTTGANAPQPITPSGLVLPSATTSLLWGLETDGGPGLLGFGYGGKGGVPYVTQTSGTTYPRSVAGGYSGEIKTIFQTVTANTTVTIGPGGAGGAEIIHSAGSGGGSAGQKGGTGFCILFYWW